MKRNLTMLMDFYELTMGNEYYINGLKDTVVYFDMFYRRNPDKGGYVICAGLEQLIDYIKNIKFSKEDIEYLRSLKMFDEGFLNYLVSFRFTGDIWAVPEGTPVFPGEALVTVKAPVIEAQLVETMLLISINHQSLIATKANRIVRAAQGRPVYEFGSRRAQGADGAIYGARASIIGGCMGTACTIVGENSKVPISGTMAHSNVQLLKNEYDAFKMYARTYPDKCALLVDTYNVLKSGVPNAIKVFDEEVVPRGFRPMGIRIDSGDLTYLSTQARKMLDDAGYKDAQIGASNSLDENIIRDVISEGAKLDWFGVGENMITAKSEAVFGGVYKLVAVEENGTISPRIKISENVEKITNPGFKKTYRLYGRNNNKAIADVITLHDEIIDENNPYVIFDPNYTWKKKIVKNFYVKELQTKVFENGECIYTNPSVTEIRDICKKQLDTLWEEVLRFENPHTYYVDLSRKLWNVKQEELDKYSFE